MIPGGKSMNFERTVKIYFSRVKKRSRGSLAVAVSDTRRFTRVHATMDWEVFCYFHVDGSWWSRDDKKVKSGKHLVNRDAEMFHGFCESSNWNVSLHTRLFSPIWLRKHSPDFKFNWKGGKKVENIWFFQRTFPTCLSRLSLAALRCQKINFNDFESGIIQSPDDVKEFHLSFSPKWKNERFHHSSFIFSMPVFVVCVLNPSTSSSCKDEAEFPLKPWKFVFRTCNMNPYSATRLRNLVLTMLLPYQFSSLSKESHILKENRRIFISCRPSWSQREKFSLFSRIFLEIAFFSSGSRDIFHRTSSTIRSRCESSKHEQSSQSNVSP